MGRPRSPAEIKRDRNRIAELYLQGWKQQAIADKLDIDQSTVSRDIKQLLKNWQRDAAVSIDTLQGELRQKYERIYYEAFTAWLRSLENKETQVQESIEGGRGGDREKDQTKTEGQSGNPAHLAQAQAALKAIREMTGMDKEPGSDEDKPFVIKVLKGVSPDDL